MAFQLNGTEVQELQLNGVDVDELQLDGVTVWLRGLPDNKFSSTGWQLDIEGLFTSNVDGKLVRGGVTRLLTQLSYTTSGYELEFQFDGNVATGTYNLYIADPAQGAQPVATRNLTFSSRTILFQGDSRLGTYMGQVAGSPNSEWFFWIG